MSRCNPVRRMCRNLARRATAWITCPFISRLKRLTDGAAIVRGHRTWAATIWRPISEGRNVRAIVSTSGSSGISRAYRAAMARPCFCPLFVEHLSDAAPLVRSPNGPAQQAAHREYRQPILQHLLLVGGDRNRVGGDYPLQRQCCQ